MLFQQPNEQQEKQENQLLPRGFGSGGVPGFGCFIEDCFSFTTFTESLPAAFASNLK